MCHNDGKYAQAAADALQRVSSLDSAIVDPYNEEIINKVTNTKYDSTRWHICMMIGRMKLKSSQIEGVKNILLTLFNKDTSKIVKVDAMQALYDLSLKNDSLVEAADCIVKKAQDSSIPSLQARARILSKK